MLDKLHDESAKAITRFRLIPMRSESTQAECLFETQRSNEAARQSLHRIERAAAKYGCLTNILHHIDADLLRLALRRCRFRRAIKANLHEQLSQIANAVISQTYTADPATLVISDHGKPRHFWIPTHRDQLVQRAICEILSAILESKFASFSYGYRPGRSAHQALEYCLSEIRTGQFHWIAKLDVRNCFESIDVLKLQRLLELHVRDRRFNKLLFEMLSTGGVVGSVKGLPQGFVLSPRLSNLYLDGAIDRHFAESSEAAAREVSVIRYADDICMLFSDEKTARRIYSESVVQLSRYGLKPSCEKSIEPVRLDSDSRLPFLGFELRITENGPNWITPADRVGAIISHIEKEARTRPSVELPILVNERITYLNLKGNEQVVRYIQDHFGIAS